MVDPLLVELAKYGLLGAILAWFMFRLERVLDRLADRMDDLTIAIAAPENRLAADALQRARLRQSRRRITA